MITYDIVTMVTKIRHLLFVPLLVSGGGYLVNYENKYYFVIPNEEVYGRILKTCNMCKLSPLKKNSNFNLIYLQLHQANMFCFLSRRLHMHMFHMISICWRHYSRNIYFYKAHLPRDSNSYFCGDNEECNIEDNKQVF